MSDETMKSSPIAVAITESKRLLDLYDLGQVPSDIQEKRKFLVELRQIQEVLNKSSENEASYQSLLLTNAIDELEKQIPAESTTPQLADTSDTSWLDDAFNKLNASEVTAQAPPQANSRTEISPAATTSVAGSSDDFKDIRPSNTSIDHWKLTRQMMESSKGLNTALAAPSARTESLTATQAAELRQLIATQNQQIQELRELVETLRKEKNSAQSPEGQVTVAPPPQESPELPPKPTEPQKPAEPTEPPTPNPGNVLSPPHTELSVVTPAIKPGEPVQQVDAADQQASTASHTTQSGDESIPEWLRQLAIEAATGTNNLGDFGDDDDEDDGESETDASTVPEPPKYIPPDPNFNGMDDADEDEEEDEDNDKHVSGFLRKPEQISNQPNVPIFTDPQPRSPFAPSAKKPDEVESKPTIPQYTKPQKKGIRFPGIGSIFGGLGKQKPDKPSVDKLPNKTPDEDDDLNDNEDPFALPTKNQQLERRTIFKDGLYRNIDSSREEFSHIISEQIKAIQDERLTTVGFDTDTETRTTLLQLKPLMILNPFKVELTQEASKNWSENREILLGKRDSRGQPQKYIKNLLLELKFGNGLYKEHYPELQTDLEAIAGRNVIRNFLSN